MDNKFGLYPFNTFKVPKQEKVNINELKTLEYFEGIESNGKRILEYITDKFNDPNLNLEEMPLIAVKGAFLVDVHQNYS
jgi:hypothetical protein